jgi:hypothetical protein
MKKLVSQCNFVSTYIFVVLTSLAGFANAHHSAIAFDLNAPLITVTGKVTQFIWRSPHTSINMEVENAEGVIEIWKLEGGGTVSLVNNGVTRDSIKPGHIISVTANPLRDKGPGGLMKAITLEDGRVIDFSNGAPPSY